MKRKDVRKVLEKTYKTISEECDNGGFDGIVIVNKIKLTNIEEPISADRVFEILEKERPL